MPPSVVTSSTSKRRSDDLAYLATVPTPPRCPRLLQEVPSKCHAAGMILWILLVDSCSKISTTSTTTSSLTLTSRLEFECLIVHLEVIYDAERDGIIL